MIAGVQELAEANWRNGETTEHLWEARVTPNFFTGLGVPVFLGRPITEHTPGEAVISYSMWRRKFAAQPDILGRKLILDGDIYTIVGSCRRITRPCSGWGSRPTCT